MLYNNIIHNRNFLNRLERLEQQEADRIFCRHGLSHLLDVCRIAYIDVLENNLGFSRDVVYGAGLLHDIGRVEQYESGVSHDQASAAAAGEILPECGYSYEDIALICDAVRSHREARDGRSLGAILYKADKASRCCFSCRAQDRCKWPEEKRNKEVLR